MYINSNYKFQPEFETDLGLRFLEAFCLGLSISDTPATECSCAVNNLKVATYLN